MERGGRVQCIGSHKLEELALQLTSGVIRITLQLEMCRKCELKSRLQTNVCCEDFKSILYLKVFQKRFFKL